MEFSLFQCVLRKHRCKTFVVKKTNNIYTYLKPRPPSYEVRLYFLKYELTYMLIEQS